MRVLLALLFLIIAFRFVILNVLIYLFDVIIWSVSALRFAFYFLRALLCSCRIICFPIVIIWFILQYFNFVSISQSIWILAYVICIAFLCRKSWFGWLNYLSLLLFFLFLRHKCSKVHRVPRFVCRVDLTFSIICPWLFSLFLIINLFRVFCGRSIL